MKFTLFALLFLIPMLVLVTGFWDFVNKIILPNTTWGLYGRDFFENLLVEIHGAVFDLIIVGVVLYWLEQRRNKKTDLKGLRQDLEDLRFYCGDDVSYITYGKLKRLISLAGNSVSIPEAKLNSLDIKDLNLKSSNITAAVFIGSRLNSPLFTDVKADAANFIDAKIQHATFCNVSFRRAKFINAQLKGVDFRHCRIEGSDFTNAKLQSAIFNGVNCKGVSFKGANLRSTNFKNATNLTREMLLEAESVAYVKLPKGLTI
ncbi:pentapeptide repeat-containing protein [Vreelandella titanicae]|uniref:pentapeptide repeat-containing protein n=1 Tax=Vreelandella titanicae TaxID=664683 RepID=UPI001F3FA4DB|nr:pentapeptide repeat-containing protein [Halomonas titanicae]MCE7518707.1 pentapeptide repeat-containing protein [Halomonas titanicae]